MTLRIMVFPSDLTPPPGAFQTLVADVLAAQGASWIETPEEGDLRLKDGTELGLFLDDEENVAAINIDGQGDAALDLIHDLADAAKGFVAIDRQACAFPMTGDPVPGLDAFDDPADLAGRRMFGDWMAAAIARATPKPASVSTPAFALPQRSLMQRLSDALFGKSM